MAGIDMNLGRRIDTRVGSLLLALLYLWSSLRARFGGPSQPAKRSTTPPDEVKGVEGAPRRILAIKLYGLGNIAMILPVLAALRRAYPDVEVEFLSLDENRSLLERSGLVDRVISVKANGYVGLAIDLLKAFLGLRRSGYDLVLDFEQFIKLSPVITYWTGAPRRIGFNTDGQGRGALYTTRVVYRDGDHMSEVFMRLLRPLGIERSDDPLDLEIYDEEVQAVDRFLADAEVSRGQRPLVVVHVGSGPNFYKLALKRWPPGDFGKLCDRLIQERGAHVVFTGKGEEESGLIQEALGVMKHDATNACDRLSIGELLALLDRADLTITNDTSVMHLATLVGSAVAAFFGPTDPLQYGPRNRHDLVLYQDLYCSPCLTNYNLKISYCTNPVCIRSIGVDETFSRIDRQLAAIGFEPGGVAS
jgi:ADP-heptose:LPS heptosyltransferase